MRQLAAKARLWSGKNVSASNSAGPNIFVDGWLTCVLLRIKDSGMVTWQPIVFHPMNIIKVPNVNLKIRKKTNSFKIVLLFVI